MVPPAHGTDGSPGPIYAWPRSCVSRSLTGGETTAWWSKTPSKSTFLSHTVDMDESERNAGRHE